MSLTDRFPRTPRLALPLSFDESNATCPEALLPYLGWRLAMIEAESSDILLQSPDERDLVILTGVAASIWLKYHAPSSPHGEMDTARGPAQAGH